MQQHAVPLLLLLILYTATTTTTTAAAAAAAINDEPTPDEATDLFTAHGSACSNTKSGLVLAPTLPQNTPADLLPLSEQQHSNLLAAVKNISVVHGSPACLVVVDALPRSITFWRKPHRRFASLMYDHFGYKAGNNSGVVFVVDMGRRKLEVMSGVGIKGVLSGELSTTILTKYVKPHFKAGDYYTGLLHGLREIETVLRTGTHSGGFVWTTNAIASLGVLVCLIVVLVRDWKPRQQRRGDAQTNNDPPPKKKGGKKRKTKAERRKNTNPLRQRRNNGAPPPYESDSDESDGTDTVPGGWCKGGNSNSHSGAMSWSAGGASFGSASW